MSDRTARLVSPGRTAAPPANGRRSDPTSGDVHYALFHNLLREYTAPDGKPDRTWVSEDYAFCDRWRAIGGEIWVDVVSDLNHTGRFVYPSSQWLDRFRTAPAQSSAGEL